MMLRTIGNRSVIGRISRQFFWIASLALVLAGGIQTHADEAHSDHIHKLNAQNYTPVQDHQHLQGAGDILAKADLFVHCGADILGLGKPSVQAKHSGNGSGRPCCRSSWKQIDQGHDPPPPRFFS